MIDSLSGALGFGTVLTGAAALAYLLGGAALLFVVRVLLRRRRAISWSRFAIAVLLATTAASAGFLGLLEIVDREGSVGGGSGIGAVVAVVSAFAAGGVAGLPVLLASGWLLGTRRPQPACRDREVRRGLGLPGWTRRLALLVAVVPGVSLSMTIERSTGILASWTLLVLGVLGLAGLRESLFCSHWDGEKDKTITRALLGLGILAAGVTTGILLFLSLTGRSYLHRSNRSVVEWAILLTVAAAPLAIEAWRLRRL